VFFAILQSYRFVNYKSFGIMLNSHKRLTKSCADKTLKEALQQKGATMDEDQAPSKWQLRISCGAVAATAMAAVFVIMTH
jgi:hypothetical protein